MGGVINKRDNRANNKQISPMLDGESNTVEFEVEKIVAKISIDNYDNGIRYLVKWKGYDNSENSWETLDSFPEDSELLQEFEKNVVSPPKQSAFDKAEIIQKMTPIMSGVERGYYVEKIVSLIKHQDLVYFVLKYKNLANYEVMEWSKGVKLFPDKLKQFFQNNVYYVDEVPSDEILK